MKPRWIIVGLLCVFVNSSHALPPPVFDSSIVNRIAVLVTVLHLEFGKETNEDILNRALEGATGRILKGKVVELTFENGLKVYSGTSLRRVKKYAKSGTIHSETFSGITVYHVGVKPSEPSQLLAGFPFGILLMQDGSDIGNWVITVGIATVIYVMVIFKAWQFLKGKAGKRTQKLDDEIEMKGLDELQKRKDKDKK